MTTRVCTREGPSDTTLPADAKQSVKELHWFVSLTGDDEARLSPLNRNGKISVVSNRYEWAMGVVCCADPEKWWDWERRLRSEDAFKVQLLIQVPESVAWSEIDAQLLALRPSRDTRSWFEDNSERALKALSAAARVARSADLPGYAKYPLGYLNAIPSEAVRMLQLRRKNWFLYRYFDVQTRRAALEWTISRAVVKEYGPLLRGAVDVAYYGAASGDAKVDIGLRVGVGFRGQFELHYARPPAGNERDSELEIHTRIEATVVPPPP